MESVTTPHTDADSKPQRLYRCKRCRRIVATEENVLIHNPKEGDTYFKGKRRARILDSNLKAGCFSIFVEPMKWMEAVHEGVVEEKLWCIGCRARLGSFNWAGVQCSCGTWVNPAFQLHKSRIDECMP